MAKTIKFNLILDGYPVRDIEGIQEHFSIEDILKYYENGLLLRWLEVRGYEKEFNEVKAIDQSIDKKSIVVMLIRIFDVVDCEMEDIEKAIGILAYLEEENELNKIYRENAFAKKQVIDDYHAGYAALIIHMEENKNNMSAIKADVIQMEKEYIELFALNNYELFFRLLETAPKAIFAILTRDVFRNFWIGDSANEKIYSNMKDKLLKKAIAKEILGEDIRIVKRHTQQMWDPIVKPEVKLMVISIEPGTFVKNAGEFSEKLSANDVNYKLLKLNGLEYQCNNENFELLYMEV